MINCFIWEMVNEDDDDDFRWKSGMTMLYLGEEPDQKDPSKMKKEVRFNSISHLDLKTKGYAFLFYLKWEEKSGPDKITIIHQS